MPFVNANDTSLYYEVHGEGDPIVFANGIFANTLSWFKQTPVFSKEYQVILYDMRGQGRSEKSEGPYSFDLHVEDQKALLDELGVGSVHHVGISYGAELGLVFCLKYPSLVKSLVVCDGASFVGPSLRMTALLWRSAAVRGDAEMFYYATVPFNFSETFIQRQSRFIEEALARYRQLDFPSVVRLVDSFLQLDITQRLPDIQVPALVLVGEKDILKPIPYSEIIHRNLHQSEMVIVGDSGHATTLEKPDEFNSIVLGFLNKQKIWRMSEEA